MPSVSESILPPATPSSLPIIPVSKAPQEEASPEQLNEQINDLFNKIEANFEHNCRAFRTRSAMVMQKVEEMESALQELIDSLQDGNDHPGGTSSLSLGSTKIPAGPEMVSMIMPDNDLETPSVRQ